MQGSGHGVFQDYTTSRQERLSKITKRQNSQ